MKKARKSIFLLVVSLNYVEMVNFGTQFQKDSESNNGPVDNGLSTPNRE